LRKIRGLGGLVVESVARELLRLSPTMAHFRQHLDCFLALERPEITIEALAWLRRVQLLYLEELMPDNGRMSGFKDRRLF
jgi:hypothetical protein